MLHSVIYKTNFAHSWQWRGVGHCSGHFGELIQGKFTAPSGKINRGLVTLPCRGIGTTAEVSIYPGNGSIEVPVGKTKILNAITEYCQANDIGEKIDITVQTKSTILPGIGMGSSTADIVSVLRALDQAFGWQSTPEQRLRVVMSAESACDPAMYDSSPKLFAQREGVILEEYNKSLPALVILGFNMMPGQTFSTDDKPPAEYTKSEIQQFDAIRIRLRKALNDQDMNALGRISTESATINQRKYPKNQFDRLIETSNLVGALGVCISHSGTISGLLFNAMDDDLSKSLCEAAKQMRDPDIGPLGTFRI